MNHYDTFLELTEEKPLKEAKYTKHNQISKEFFNILTRILYRETPLYAHIIKKKNTLKFYLNKQTA